MDQNVNNGCMGWYGYCWFLSVHLCSYLFSKLPIFLKVSGLKYHNILRRKHKRKMKISGKWSSFPIWTTCGPSFRCWRCRSVHGILLTGAGGSPRLSSTLASGHSRDYQVVVRVRKHTKMGGLGSWVTSNQRVQLLTQHWPWSVPAAGHSTQFTSSALLSIAWMAHGKDVDSECKDFDNIVRTIEIHTGNYNARHNVENPTTDVQSEGWNKAVWGSGFGVTQAWDTRCHQCDWGQGATP